MCALTWDICITHKMIWSSNLHQSTFLTKFQKPLEGHGCKPRITNLSIIPHTLMIVLEYVNKSQVNTGIYQAARSLCCWPNNVIPESDTNLFVLFPMARTTNLNCGKYTRNELVLQSYSQYYTTHHNIFIAIQLFPAVVFHCNFWRQGSTHPWNGPHSC